MRQCNALRAAVIVALVALAVHEESALRHIIRTDKNLPIFALTAHKRSGCRRHRQDHIVLSVYLLLRERAAGHNAAADVDRAGLLRCGGIFGVARRVVDGSAYPRGMSFAARTPYCVKIIAVFQHLDRGIEGEGFRRGAGAQGLAARPVAERCRADIIHAEVVVCRDLRIAQRDPESCLRCAEKHVRCEVLFRQRRAYGGDDLVERHAGIAHGSDAIHVHIIHAPGNGVRHTARTRIALAVVCAVCADLRAVRCSGIHRPDITRRAVLLEPCLLYAPVCNVVHFAYLDRNG